MRQGGGKAKGTSFERQVCKMLSVWVTAGLRDDVFWRSAISGGRATVGAKKGKDLSHVSGDICSVHEAGFPLTNAFYIECKSYKNLMLSRMLVEQKGTMVKFWKKTIKQARDNNKLPMLIWKQNLLMVCVCLDDAGWDVFKDQLKTMNISIPSLDLISVTFHRLLKTDFKASSLGRKSRSRLGL